ncbi:Alpha/Beta hydrolase protein [Mycena metata]|uniref:Alpha/Beta hydrolase protein n=1 Tax=Mycena metata TaxID=1033252 RepID=A0AAD7K7S0_9AGAR|nr:Alpha/Beta hydrolase protein [Mycena metata]
MAHLPVVLLALASFATAGPALRPRQAITSLSAAQIAAYKPYTFYAAAGYCEPATTLAWDCGANCEANPGFQPVASGGDGDATQFWFVGADTKLGTVIVSHQGTDPSQILALVTDSDFFLDSLSPTLFPGLSSSIEVHNGFANEQAKTAPQVLAAVQTALSQFSLKKVTIVGHSLGGAISLIDSVYLPLHITGVTFQTIVYGLPRVGNQAFADYASIGSTVTHINNKEDIVPILPGMFLGFHHPTGEIHIQDSLAWDTCPGEDNESDLCSTGDVPNIFEGDESDHDGPYDSVLMASSC